MPGPDLQAILGSADTVLFQGAQGMENAIAGLLRCCQTSASSWLLFPWDTTRQEKLDM